MSHYVHSRFSMVAAGAGAEASRQTPLHLCVWDQSLQHHVGNQFSTAPGQDGASVDALKPRWSLNK